MLRVYNLRTGELVETTGQRQARSMFFHLHLEKWSRTECIIESNDFRLCDWFAYEWERKEFNFFKREFGIQ
jgi:hypothetical protein